MKRILLLGGRGYIGSRFNYDYHDIYDITNIDLDWFTTKTTNSIDFNILDSSYIAQYDAVILLAGHSSVKMCDGTPTASFSNNVSNFISLLKNIQSTQKFIYASSSSVYGNTDNQIVDETYSQYTANNYYDLSKQIIDMYALKSNLDYYGLRFGTVNGWSPHLRTDIMINAMVTSALTNNHIKLYTKHIQRPILDINDLMRALKVILDCPIKKSGIYNLASFNSTPSDIANIVSSIVKCDVVEHDIETLKNLKNINLQPNAYNFSISSKKFENNYNFKFEGTIESITRSLLSNNKSIIQTTRNNIQNYNE